MPPLLFRRTINSITQAQLVRGDGNMIEVTIQKAYQFVTPMVSIFTSDENLVLETSQVELILRPECP